MILAGSFPSTPAAAAHLCTGVVFFAVATPGYGGS